ncbi:hypothetical protein SAMN05444266_102466 [Chitinophaga jiangningensis]|uniref:Uncharacterized protein n=1 Tax=Chitinophaga jiangningensis TaxID=1419482 RepID=A0A1M6YSL3_9BACT|nr:hypothetical protein [Chitinophaga jiangningensis]SHL21207.1 hypothetical protein SAMN05444266_102466 [Chitinophaga jiangningensis]
MSKSTKQKLQELAHEVKLLKEQKAQLGTQEEKKAAILDMMIAIAEQEYNLEARKKRAPAAGNSQFPGLSGEQF